MSKVKETQIKDVSNENVIETEAPKTTVKETVDTKEPTPEEKYKQLNEFRKNGNVTLDITYSAFKYIRNTFKNKIKWIGPNQAYLLCVLNMNMEQALSTMDTKSTEAQKVALRNDSIEAISVFINDISGDNYHSAQNNLSMFLQIQNAISQLQSIDKQISDLEKSNPELKPKKTSN